MTQLKKVIFDEVKKQQPDLQILDDDDLNKLIFHHPDGLRLSLVGYKIIRKIFTAYPFEIPNTIRSRHQTNLGKMEYPYYFTSKKIIVFSEMDATMIKIHGGIQSFLEVYS